MDDHGKARCLEFELRALKVLNGEDRVSKWRTFQLAKVVMILLSDVRRMDAELCRAKCST